MVFGELFPETNIPTGTAPPIGLLFAGQRFAIPVFGIGDLQHMVVGTVDHGAEDTLAIGDPAIDIEVGMTGNIG